MTRVLRFQAQLWHFSAARLHHNNLPAMAAALSFRTIFALVPTLVLALLAASALGVLEDSKQSLRQVLASSGFTEIVAVSDNEPASQPGTAEEQQRAINVADEILALVERVEGKLTFQRVGPIGAALFIWTALSLLSTMEDSLNRVFGAARSRSTVRRVLLYWSAMTLGPVLLAVTTYIGRNAIRTAQDLPVFAWLITGLGFLGPALVGVLVVSGIYVLLPNTRVNRGAALGGALAAVLLWLVARWGFAIYVERFVFKGNLYGILGVLPLFLLWLNVSWMIFLFGAELAHTAVTFRVRDRVDTEEGPVVLTADDAVAVSLCVARDFEAGKRTSITNVAQETGLPLIAARYLLDRLVERGVLCVASDAAGSRYMPARPAQQISAAEIVTACGRLNGPAPPSAALRRWRESRAALDGLTLAELLAEERR